MVVLGEHRLAAWTYMTMGAQGCVDSPGWLKVPVASLVKQESLVDAMGNAGH